MDVITCTLYRFVQSAQFYGLCVLLVLINDLQAIIYLRMHITSKTHKLSINNPKIN